MFKDCPDCPEMVVIPAGSFVMGSNDAGEHEKPLHSVSVASFAMGKFEVSRGEFGRFIKASGYKTDAEKGNGCYVYKASSWNQDEAANWRNMGFSQTDDHPVVCVSWNDAQAYVKWLVQHSGQPYQLPSEAEWEYAARAHSANAYWWGDVASHEYANYGKKDGCCGPLSEGRDRWDYTAPVGQFPVNPFGLFDMNGNVSEWVADADHDSYNGAPTDGSVWLSGGAHSSYDSTQYVYVVRGSNWSSHPFDLRSAYRFWGAPVIRKDHRGFRLARTLVTP